MTDQDKIYLILKYGSVAIFTTGQRQVLMDYEYERVTEGVLVR